MFACRIFTFMNTLMLKDHLCCYSCYISAGKDSTNTIWQNVKLESDNCSFLHFF